MIALRRALERHHDFRGKQEDWRTFARPDHEAEAFGALEVFDEMRLQPGGVCAARAHRDAEIITYLRTGSLAYGDSQGRSGVLAAGEFQRVTAARAFRHSETNVSEGDPAQVFQIWLRSGDPAHSGLSHRRFSTAERRGTLRVIASPDARSASLRLHQDVLLYSALLAPGQHVAHPLATGRRAWLHVVEGELHVNDLMLATGDGVGIDSEPVVSITARVETELLLLDLG